MVNTLLVIFMLLGNGDFYTPPNEAFATPVQCMDRAMLLADSYRKSDLIRYKFFCVGNNTKDK